MADDTNASELPNLRFLDQTPISSKQDAKRSKPDSSPIAESFDEENFLSKIDKMFESRINILIPTCISQMRNELISQVRSEIQAAIPSAVKQVVEQIKEELKTEILRHVEGELYYQEERCNAAAMSQAESIENYNRRENIRIIGLKEDVQQIDNGGIIPEKDTVTIKKVIEGASSLGVAIDEKDISTAHRLPGGKVGERTIIARFARRVVKTDILRNKKKLSANTNSVKIFEDISPARAKFPFMMKRDSRVESAWTREGTILYLWKENKKIYRVLDLLDAAKNLNYDFSEFMKCFRPSRSNVFPTSSPIDYT